MRTQNHRYSQWPSPLENQDGLIMMILMTPGFPGKSAKSGTCDKLNREIQKTGSDFSDI